VTTPIIIASSIGSQAVVAAAAGRLR